MTTPKRGLLFHITHISNLPSIAQDGLYCDHEVMDSNRRYKDVGNADIKSNRRTRRVPISPGGFVADYVPFYFAARSPMLYAIHMGNVPTYTAGQDEVVYLVTTVDSIQQHRLRFVFTDRNAALGFARYGDYLTDLDGFVDWDLMEAQMWNNTPEEPDRMERRMAELLVHHHVPWSAISRVVTRTKERKRQVSAALATVGATTPASVKLGWYF